MSKVYVPDRHREILRQIYQHLGMSAEFLEQSEPNGKGALRVSYNSSLGYGEIKVLQVGQDSKADSKEGYQTSWNRRGGGDLSGPSAGSGRNPRIMRSC